MKPLYEIQIIKTTLENVEKVEVNMIPITNIVL